MRKSIIVLCGLSLFVAVCLLPGSEGLSSQGRILLGIMACMLLLWVTQAVDFSGGAFLLCGLMALACGFADAPETPGTPLGALGAMHIALQGFSSPAWILVAAALFLGAATEASGLGKRFSLLLLAAAGTKPKRIRLASYVLSLCLSLIIPSPAANSALCTALMLTIVSLLEIPRHGNLAKGIFLNAAFGPVFSTVMILTAGGGPVQAAAYIRQSTGHDLAWGEFALYGAPLCLGLSVVLYFLMERLFPVEEAPLPGAREKLRTAVQEMGPWTKREKCVAGIFAVLIPLWATAKVLHPIDAGTAAMLAAAALFLPGLAAKDAAFSWAELSSRVSWGTLLLFGAVLSFGQALLESGGAAWLAKTTLVAANLHTWPEAGIVAAGGLIFALFSLGFAARSAAVGALAPTIIGFAQSLPPDSGIPAWGLSMVLTYAVQICILVPANSPMPMVAYSSGTFTVRDMIRLSVPVTFAALALMVLLSVTWWRWLGVL